MRTSGTYKIKPVIFSTVLVLLLSVLTSCIFPTVDIFSDNAFQKASIENMESDSGEKKENGEEKEFSEKVLFSGDFGSTNFNQIRNLIEVRRFECLIPQVSLDIPVPPPKQILS
ncbi:MAG: hypothetical protein JNL60_03865 [Bacteroidia bacterium]|nr:hypothetical protein [Bacteroidia bacterium]